MQVQHAINYVSRIMQEFVWHRIQNFCGSIGNDLSTSSHVSKSNVAYIWISPNLTKAIPTLGGGGCCVVLCNSLFSK